VDPVPPLTLTPTAIADWVTPAELEDCVTDDSVDLVEVCATATRVLARLVGWRFGSYAVAERPIVSACNEAVLAFPVVGSLSVSVEGVAVPAADFRLEGHYRLVLGVPVPEQRLDRSLGATGTWGASYETGWPLTPDAKAAARLYACELAKLAAGDPACRLPTGTTSVTREGVTVTVDTPSGEDRDRTGLPSVDLWIESVNPEGLRSRPRAVNPDDLVTARASGRRFFSHYYGSGWNRV